MPRGPNHEELTSQVVSWSYPTTQRVPTKVHSFYGRISQVLRQYTKSAFKHRNEKHCTRAKTEVMLPVFNY